MKRSARAACSTANLSPASSVTGAAWASHELGVANHNVSSQSSNTAFNSSTTSAQAGLIDMFSRSNWNIGIRVWSRHHTFNTLRDAIQRSSVEIG